MDGFQRRKLEEYCQFIDKLNKLICCFSDKLVGLVKEIAALALEAAKEKGESE